MKSLIAIFIGGIVFGVGLAISGLMKQETVLNFLQLDDLGLILTMGTAMLITLPIYQLAPRLRKAPLVGGAFDCPPRFITKRTVVGGVLFGVGWGVAGVCPGAAVASLGAGNWPILTAIAGMLVGAYVQGALAPAPVAVSN